MSLTELANVGFKVYRCRCHTYS